MITALNVALFIGDVTAMAGLTLLPAVFAIDWRLHHKIDHLRYLTIFAALMLSLHLVYLAWVFRQVLNPPPGVFITDTYPLDNLLVFTLNWTIPLGFLALLFAFLLPRLKRDSKRMLAPAVAFILPALCALMYTRHLNQTYFAGLLSNRIWWF
jgi:hypothetical protein